MISFINYKIMKKRIDKIILPDFKDSKKERWAILFEGRVKRVAFRNEAILIAKKLSLTGHVKNVKEGVYLEVEGYEDRLNYFLKHILTTKRFRIMVNTMDILELKNEKEFRKKWLKNSIKLHYQLSW